MQEQTCSPALPDSSYVCQIGTYLQQLDTRSSLAMAYCHMGCAAAMHVVGT